MATSRKLDSSLKEKSGSSPSSTLKKPAKSSTTTNQKQVPSYLKPTVSSSGHVDHQDPPAKKQGISATKTNLNRRRSFDKPPSSSVIHNKSHISTQSPSPVLSRTKTSPKPLTKKVIQPCPRARANTGTKKTNAAIPSANEKEMKIEEVGNCKKEDETLLVNDVEEEEVKGSEIDDDKLADSEVPNVGNPSTREDVKASDLLEESERAVDVEIEGAGEKAVAEEVVADNHDEKNGEENEIGKEEEKEDGKEEDGSENIGVAESGESSEIVSKEGDPGKGGEYEEEKDGKGEEVTSEVQNAKKEAQQQAVHYNDVIEETKNKLLEKRKNKVKALVGAFETVMSLEEP